MQGQAQCNTDIFQTTFLLAKVAKDQSFLAQKGPKTVLSFGERTKESTWDIPLPPSLPAARLWSKMNSLWSANHV